MHLALRPIILAPERSYAVRGQRDEATHSEANGIDCGASRLRRWTLPEGAARARASAQASVAPEERPFAASPHRDSA